VVIEVPLSHGQIALVDDEDAGRVMQYNWQAWYDRRSRQYRVSRTGANGKAVHLPRFILCAARSTDVDHRNHEPLDNRRENLRSCTTSQNLMNQRLRNGPKASRFKGVTWYRARHKWRAQIMLNYRNIGIGDFNDEIEAAHAYDAKARELFGEFARPNFPSEN
jgi:hypothetical protein